MANVLNLDALVRHMISNCRFGLGAASEALAKWAEDKLREGMQSMIYATLCKELDIVYKQAITARELRLMSMFRKGLSASDLVANVSVLGSTSYHIIMPADVEANPWIARAMADGDDIVWFDVKNTDPGVFAHYVDAVRWKFPDRESYSVTLTQARDIAKEWQVWLDKQGKEMEGLIEVVLVTPSEGKLPNTQLVKLIDKQALVREGYLMHHCVGSYDPNPDVDILSVRQGTRILATVEVRKFLTAPGLYGAAIVQQIRGPSNQSVSAEVDEFVRAYVHSQWVEPTYEQKQHAGLRQNAGLVYEALENDPMFREQALGRIERRQMGAWNPPIFALDETQHPMFEGGAARREVMQREMAEETGDLTRAAGAQLHQAVQRQLVADLANANFAASLSNMGTASAGPMTPRSFIDSMSDNDMQAFIARLRQAGARI